MSTNRESRDGLENMLLVTNNAKLVILFWNGTNLVKLEEKILNFKIFGSVPMKLWKILVMTLTNFKIYSDT